MKITKYEYSSGICGYNCQNCRNIDRKNQGYTIKQDHKEIKEQIKEWENRLDTIINCLLHDEKRKIDQHYDCLNDLENISHEMMAINI